MSVSGFRTVMRFVSAAATVGTMTAKLAKRDKVRRVCKMLVVPPLIDYRDPLMVVGGFGHAMGDLVLLRKNRKLEQGALWFALGHVAMTARQIRRGVGPQYPALYAGLWLAACPIIRDPKLIAYAGALSTYASFSHSPGGLMFLLSDALIVANKRFAHPLLDAAVTLTYGSAQLMLFAPNDMAKGQVN